MELTLDTITFGKHKGSDLQTLLKDRQYCSYLISQDWFRESYAYLYAKIADYDPLDFFLKKEDSSSTDFMVNYRPFLLKSLEEVLSSGLALSKDEQICYLWYKDEIFSIRDKILERIYSDISNPYNVKVPTKYLQKFETQTKLDREVLKTFLYSYDLKGITSIVEDVKKEAGIESKASKGFVIAKERSTKQEKFWSDVLKGYYKEYISEQFKLDNCKFDFINIKTNTIFEAKLSFKDFNEKQYVKYKMMLNKFSIVYLIGETTIVDIQKKCIYTTDYASTIDHQVNIPLNSKATYLDELIFDFEIEPVDSVFQALEKL